MQELGILMPWTWVWYSNGWSGAFLQWLRGLQMDVYQAC